MKQEIKDVESDEDLIKYLQELGVSPQVITDSARRERPNAQIVRDILEEDDDLLHSQD